MLNVNINKVAMGICALAAMLPTTIAAGTGNIYNNATARQQAVDDDQAIADLIILGMGAVITLTLVYLLSWIRPSETTKARNKLISEKNDFEKKANNYSRQVQELSWEISDLKEKAEEFKRIERQKDEDRKNLLAGKVEGFEQVPHDLWKLEQELQSSESENIVNLVNAHNQELLKKKSDLEHELTVIEKKLEITETYLNK